MTPPRHPPQHSPAGVYYLLTSVTPPPRPRPSPGLPLLLVVVLALSLSVLAWGAWCASWQVVLGGVAGVAGAVGVIAAQERRER